MTTLLAGDVGGTKTLLALYTSGPEGLEAWHAERYRSADWGDFAVLVNHFLHQAARLHPHLAQPRAGCLAIAGPVQAGKVKLTNLPWDLEEAALAQSTGIERLELVNDFAVLIHGLPHLADHQQVDLRSGLVVAGAPVAILGAGTGLGVAIGAQGPQGLLALASEAGHGEFAARSPQEWELKRWLQAELGLERLSLERVVSGTGLGLVFRWFVASRQFQGRHPLAPADPAQQAQDLPAAVAAAAISGDPLASEALNLWLGAYGSAAGDLALQTLCRGGLWLGGGTAGKLLPHLRSRAFLGPFLAKGRLSAVLETIPVRALIDPEAGLFSAACRARTLLG
ncbi:glucokinase [Cyanobium sp. Morenito 9A2]|uniref:glucokinase n=1 Tax=Cyanobium sp. Morenito 9A2 TaxID=2823718 RepID=UPI0020CE7868|nr:glucokinase [Cyanobium sp. Morenito 9A2]MCP9849395.1 glucokinase [Cyanobium sp. Morenito 9A2]